MAITRAQQARQMYKTAGAVEQDGSLNFIKNSESVTVPKEFKARKNAPATKLAYITADEAKSGTIFTNRGASGTVAFTLPAPSADLTGVRILLVAIAAEVISVETATADTLITMGDVAADKLAAPGSIGAEIECWCDGTSWIALGRGETAGNTASLNYTVTT